MSKKRRSRARQRALVRPAPVTAPSEDRRVDDRRATPPAPVRPRFSRPGTIARATGLPSQSLMRAATAEYGFVVKDLRRIVITAGGSVLVLALVTIVANTIIR